MQLSQRIAALVQLGKVLENKLENGQLDSFLYKAQAENGWFTSENSAQSLKAIIKYFLNEEYMVEWLSRYNLQQMPEPKTVALVLAGNIPLVGWHDIQCVLVSGHKAQIKLSGKDKVLPQMVLDELLNIEPVFTEQLEVADQLKNFDAVIATGSTNTARYFEYYFGKYPHIIRKGRNSVALVTGEETDEELQLLGEDIFSYFGLGCRNVSKLYVPEGYNFNRFFENIEQFAEIRNHNKYRNNYEYHKSLLLLNKEPHLDNGFLIIKEAEPLCASVASVNYEFYSTAEGTGSHIRHVEKMLQANADKLQCVVSSDGVISGSSNIATVNFGETQKPMLWDYADGVDVMEFLLKL